MQQLPRTDAAADTNKWHELARAIIAGDDAAAMQIDDRYGYDVTPLYNAVDWRDAAECALDGDHSDLVFMLERNAWHDQFCGWQSVDYERRQFADFDKWLFDELDWRRFVMGQRAVAA